MSVDSYVNFELLPMLVTKKSNVLCDHSNCFENQPAMNGLFTAAGGHFQSKARSSRGNGMLTTGFSNHLAKISLFYEIPDHKKQKVISNDTIRIVNVSVTYLWGLIYHNVLISVVIRRHEGGDWAARMTSGRIPRKF